jgi:hypothetical protein
VFAVTGLDNFVKLHGVEPDEAYEEMVKNLLPGEQRALQEARDRADKVFTSETGLVTRDWVAQWLDTNWREYLEERDNIIEEEVGGDRDDMLFREF